MSNALDHARAVRGCGYLCTLHHSSASMRQAHVQFEAPKEGCNIITFYKPQYNCACAVATLRWSPLMLKLTVLLSN